MPKHITFGIVGLLLGLTAGFFAANSINRRADQMRPLEPARSVASTSGALQASNVDLQADVAETIAKAEAEPSNFAVQMQTGDLYAKIGKFKEAIEFYRKGVTLKPNDFQANVVLANAYFDSRQYTDAATYYEAALSLKPDDVNARTDFGTTFLERESPDYERAIKEYDVALQTDPANEPTLYYLGLAYYRKGDTPKANSTLMRLQKTNPTSVLIEKLKQNMNTSRSTGQPR